MQIMKEKPQQTHSTNQLPQFAPEKEKYVIKIVPYIQMPCGEWVTKKGVANCGGKFTHGSKEIFEGCLRCRRRAIWDDKEMVNVN